MEIHKLKLEDIEKYSQIKKEIAAYRVHIGNLVRMWEVRNMKDWQSFQSWDICDKYIEITYSYDVLENNIETHEEYDFIKIPIDDFITEVNSYIDQL